MNIKTVSVPCPNCQKKVLMTEAYPDRPFCSKRCKDIDFGAWADERYAIEAKETDEDENWSGDGQF